jgi:hypothetical protein
LGKKKNTIGGDCGRVFIGSPVVVDERSVSIGGRDVELAGAVALSRAPRDEGDGVDLVHFVFIRSEGVIGLGPILVLGYGLGC